MTGGAWEAARAGAASEAGAVAGTGTASGGGTTGGGGTGVAGAEPVIRLSSVAYTYRGPPPVAALKPTNLVIHRGEHVAITGPSGSGKSTLLNLLGLLDRPTQGTIEIDGIDVGAASERERAAVRAHRIGFVFQSFHLLPYRTAIENVMLAQVYADEPRKRRRAAAMAALAQVGLDMRAHALPTALSGGEQQRVAIARALVNHPSMLMCDEPTGNLDTATTLELTDLLDSLRREGTTLVVITHNPVVASRAQRKFAIRDGALTDPAEQGAQAEQHEIRNGTLTEPTEPLAEHGDADAWPDR